MPSPSPWWSPPSESPSPVRTALALPSGSIAAMFGPSPTCRGTASRYACESVPAGSSATTATARAPSFRSVCPGLVQRYARRTVRLTEAIQLIGFALGGEAGPGWRRRWDCGVSPTALLEQLRRGRSGRAPDPRVLGVDDFAFRKGVRYGTILVDLEGRRPIELLPTAARRRWQRGSEEHPGVQAHHPRPLVRVRQRDYRGRSSRRSGGGPVPPADQPARDAGAGGRAQPPPLQGIVLPTAGREPVASVAPGEAAPRPRQPAKRSPRSRRLGAPATSAACRSGSRSTLCTSRGRASWDVSQRLNLNRSTVYRYLRQEPESGASRTRFVGSMLDAHLPYLSQRWSEGCRNASEALGGNCGSAAIAAPAGW